jgi:hypothetical protein
MRRIKMTLRTPAVLATAAALAFGAAACGGDSSSGGSASESSPPEPVAQIDALTGRSTAVALDDGFVGALETLRLTPGPVGDASIEGARASFPITSGNVTYCEPAPT